MTAERRRFLASAPLQLNTRRCEQVIKRVFYLLIFVIQENEIVISVIRDPLFFLFVNRARDPPVRPSMKIIRARRHI